MATALLVVHKRGNDMENFNVLFLDFKAERAPLLALPDILRQKVNFFFSFFHVRTLLLARSLRTFNPPPIHREVSD